MFKFIAVAVIVFSQSICFGFKLGGIIGPRFNNMTTEGTTSTTYESNALGYHVGGLISFDLLDIVGFRTGVVLTTRDIKSETPSGGVTYKYKESISYMDIPINAMVGIPATSIYFFGGFKYGIKSSSSCQVESPAGVTCNSYISSTNLIFNIGSGYELLSFGIGKLAVELEYEKGLSNINDAPGSSVKLYTQAYAVNAVALIGF